MAGLLPVVKDHSPALDPRRACCGTNRTPVLKMAHSALGLTLYAMRGEPLQHEPPKPSSALKRSVCSDLGTPWAGDTIAKRLPAGANARRRALLSVTGRASHGVQTQDD